MATTFPTTAYTNGVTAVADMINQSITKGYTPNTALSQSDIMAALLANFLTVLPAIRIYTATFDPASCSASTTTESTATVTGVATTDICLAVIPPSSLNAGLGVVAWRVSAADSIVVRFSNSTAGAIDPASASYTFVVTAKAS